MSELKPCIDIRVGCVAVYRGYQVNCFCDLPEKPNLLFYAEGKWKNGKWTISPIKILIAKFIYWYWDRRVKSKEVPNDTK